MQQTHWEPGQKEKERWEPPKPQDPNTPKPCKPPGSLPVKRSHLSNLLQH